MRKANYDDGRKRDYSLNLAPGRAALSRKKRQSACDEMIAKDRQIAGCVRPELDESFSDRGLVDPQSPPLAQAYQ